MESALYQPAPADLEVIETVGYRPGKGFSRLEMHLDRAARTAAMFSIDFERDKASALLHQSVGTQKMICRLCINHSGAMSVSLRCFQSPGKELWTARYAVARVNSQDPWRRIKTNQRALFDQTRASLEPDFDEAIFLNENGAICEGTISTLFAEIDGVMLTPSLDCGLLPGVLRQAMLADGKAVERVLYPADLERANAVYLGNSARGLIKANIVT